MRIVVRYPASVHARTHTHALAARGSRVPPYRREATSDALHVSSLVITYQRGISDGSIRMRVCTWRYRVAVRANTSRQPPRQGSKYGTVRMHVRQARSLGAESVDEKERRPCAIRLCVCVRDCVRLDRTKSAIIDRAFLFRRS